MKRVVLGIVFTLTAQALVGQTAPHVHLGIVSDWTQHHVLYPDSKDDSAMARIRRDPRWVQNWYLRHREAWWQKHHRWPRKGSRRDWSVPLGTSAFEPLFDFTFTIGSDTGYSSLNTTDLGNGEFLATAGTLTVTGLSSEIAAVSRSISGATVPIIMNLMKPTVVVISTTTREHPSP